MIYRLGSEHELRGDRGRLRTDRDDVLEGRSRGARLRALLPYERGVRTPRAHRAMGGCDAREADRLGANPWQLPGHRGLARMHVLRRVAGEESRCKGYPYGTRSSEMVRERLQHDL